MKVCDHGKFQKLHMPCSHVVAACKHVNHEYRNYIHPMYTLGSVSNICRGLFEELCNEAYWPPCHELMISPNPEKKRSTKGCPVSTHMHTEMDIRESSQPKRYFVCHITSHSKKNCPHHNIDKRSGQFCGGQNLDEKLTEIPSLYIINYKTTRIMQDSKYNKIKSRLCPRELRG
ncbi:hypothetical protein JHK86_052618 [Glycine max]|nr:hypothetical protein JHK86_052618 [Glycine max]